MFSFNASWHLPWNECLTIDASEDGRQSEDITELKMAHVRSQQMSLQNPIQELTKIVQAFDIPYGTAQGASMTQCQDQLIRQQQKALLNNARQQSSRSEKRPRLVQGLLEATAGSSLHAQVLNLI